MVQAKEHHRQEQSGQNIAGNHADHRAGGVDQQAEEPNQTVRQETGEGHQRKYVHGAHHQDGHQRCDNEVQNIGYMLADIAFHLGQQPNADDDANDAALAGGEDGVQGNLCVIQAQNCGNGYDLRANGNAADHAAERRCCAEYLGSVDAGVDGEIAEESSAKQGAQIL